MAEIFFSYKTEDRARIAPLVAALRAAGLDVWWDQDIPPGGGWRETIAAQLDSASLCVVAWSEGSTGPGGRFVREEAERAAARGAYLGVLIDPVMPPFGFAEWQAVNLGDWSGRKSDPLLAHFVEQVRARLENRPSAPDRPPPRRRRRIGALPLAAGAALLVLGALLLAIFWGRSGTDAPPLSPTAFVNGKLATIACSWLQISSVSPGEGGERIALAGIATSPEAVQASLMREAVTASIPIAEIDVADVAAGPPETCAELELLRQYRWPGRSRLAIVPPRGALRRTEYGWSGRFEFELDFAGLPARAALLGLDSIGGVEVLIPDLHAFRRGAPPLRADGSTAAYEGYFFDENQDARNVGLVLMTASAPIDTDLVEAIGTRNDRAFLDRIDRAGQAQGWRFELGLVHCGFEGGARRRC